MLSPTQWILPASQYGSSFHQERLGDGYSGRRSGFWIVVSIIGGVQIYPTKFHSCNQTERQQLQQAFNSFNLTMVKLLELRPDCVNSLSPKTIIKRWLTSGLQSMYLSLAGLWKSEASKSNNLRWSPEDKPPQSHFIISFIHSRKKQQIFHTLSINYLYLVDQLIRTN